MQFGEVIKTFESKKGNTVTFRYLKPDDLDDMLAFVNEIVREDTFVEISGKEWTREEEQRFLEEALDRMKQEQKRMVVVEVNGNYAGSGRVDKMTYRKQHVGSVGLTLAKVVRDEGIGTELLKTLIEEGKSLGLRLLELNVFSNNPRAIRAYKKAGFLLAGSTPGAIAFQGGYVDELKMFLPLV